MWLRRNDFAAGSRRRWIRLRPCHLISLFAMMLLLGLTSVPRAEADDTADAYRFGPGDRLRITVLNNPDLSGEFTVQQSGAVSLPSVGRIQVAGRGYDELESEVAKRLRESGLLDPQISVEVAEYRPIFVIGDVKAPGRYPFQMGMTVLQALAVAGGFLTFDNETLKLRLDLAQMQESIDTLEVDYVAAIAKRARLLAERDHTEDIRFPAELIERQNDPQIASIMDSENRLFATGRSAIAGAIAILENQKIKLQDAIANLQAQLKAIERRSDLVEIELRDAEYLFGKGLAAKTKMLDLQQLQTEVQTDRLGVAAAVAQAQQESSKVDLSIANLQNDRLDRILGDLAAVQKEISQLEVRRRTGTEVLALHQAMTVQPPVRLIASGETFVITRDQGNGPEDIKATDRSYVMPGDVVRFSKFELSPSAQVGDSATGVAAAGSLAVGQ